MPQEAQPYDYNALASSLVNKLLPIFGRDVLIQISYSIPEIQVSENQRIGKLGGSENQKSQRIGESEGQKTQRTWMTRKEGEIASASPRNDGFSVRVVRGDAAVVFDQLVEEFRELSPFVVERVMGELHEEEGKKLT